MAIEVFSKSATTASGRAVSSKRSFVIYTQLQREIVLGVLPPRSVLLELELANRFEASQGTVREALLLLQEEGLVHRVPHRGTTVADCRAEDAEELVRLRHDIECRNVRRAMERSGSDLVDTMSNHVYAMQEAAKQEDEYLLSLHDRAFHTELFERADLPPVQPVLARALVHVHRFKILHSAKSRDLPETANRHLVIVEALKAGDPDKAAEALSHHIMTIADFGPSILENNE